MILKPIQATICFQYDYLSKIVLKMKNRILILLVAFWSFVSFIQSKTYMVSIGVADYPGTKNDLRVSGSDARTMKNLYERNCSAEVVLLIDTDAKLDEVTRQMELEFSKASEDDTIILFFGGHGIPGGFVCYDKVLYYDTIYKTMSSSRAKSKIVYSDACYSGKARKTDKRVKAREDVNIMFFLSSRTNEQSIENRKWRNGYFTAYLERGLRGGADLNKDRTITAIELFKFVSEGVKTVSEDKQHPVMWGSFDNEMPVMIWK